MLAFINFSNSFPPTSIYTVFLALRDGIIRTLIIIVLILIFCIQVESSDLIAYGLIPEFIGRFPILVSLSALTEDQLVQVKLL